MAYKKIVQYEIMCAGPRCASNAVPQIVAKIPEDWRRIKVHRTSVPNGTNPIVEEALLCPDCCAYAIDILHINGFKFSEVKREKA